MRLVLIGRCLGLSCGSSGLGFTLAATHFTWVVRCATVGQHYRRRFSRYRRCLDNLGLGFNWCSLLDHRCFDWRGRWGLGNVH